MNKTMAKIEFAVRNKKSMTNGNYTVSVNPDTGYIAVQYHSTVVVAIFENKAYLGNGGWFTLTTKNVINSALLGTGSAKYVYQRNYKWFIDDESFYDGMEITLAS